MKVKRIVSAFLTLVMFLGSLVVPAQAAYADKVDEETEISCDLLYCSGLEPSPQHL